jgi:hypothetical protein
LGRVRFFVFDMGGYVNNSFPCRDGFDFATDIFLKTKLAVGLLPAAITAELHGNPAHTLLKRCCPLRLINSAYFVEIQ